MSVQKLLSEVVAVHGGAERWRKYSKVEVGAVTGGGMFPLKGLMPDLSRRTMTVWLHEERSSVFPFGAPDQRTMFTPERIVIRRRTQPVLQRQRSSSPAQPRLRRRRKLQQCR